MSCKYAACIFLNGLNEEDCATLCDICHTKRYARNQLLNEEYWNNSSSLILEGIMLDVQIMNNSHPVPVAVYPPGYLYGIERMFDFENMISNDMRRTFFLTNSTVAVFNTQELRELMRKNPKILQLIHRKCFLRQMRDMSNMLLHIGFGDAKTSIRYVTDSLRERGVTDLTHEQIALICNRSRQTVTTTLKQLHEEAENTADSETRP